ncbi:probable sodium/metabolite cotransporter BASS4, chloroplastic isoform X2 [Ricinus communis]|uniref:probable sodium/metabolite cotransporter BASS4, chloroplastic isoform X2 n=1 Tax=Ricinus communis TaxID=3988 RepID=UPI00201B133C|nr:probable sodium/metabolite cotransporter BASS4, chloroplastic isoform X2 [Ricinus communis]
MAGIVQSLILSPRSLQPPSIQQRHPNFRSICNPYSLKRTRCVPSPIKIKACQQPDQGDSKVSGLANVWSQPLFSFVENNFLPMALIGGVVVGLANPSLGCLADKCYLSKVSTFGIFFISGLTLRNGEIGAALEAWLVGVFGLCSILFITPYFSRIILQIQLQPQEFVTGLALFCCMPTTLSSGVALTQLAGGNSALALAMTVISNLLGILIIPFSISRFIGAGVGVSVPTKQLLRSLVLTLLVPLILGKVKKQFRQSPGETFNRCKYHNLEAHKEEMSELHLPFLFRAITSIFTGSHPLTLIIPAMERYLEGVEFGFSRILQRSGKLC